MGMGTYANFAEVVKTEFVEKICPEELNKLREVLEKSGIIMDIDQLARSCSLGDIEGELSLMIEEADVTEIITAYEALCNKFEKETGLELNLNYHDRDDGDRGDDINGAFWTVDNVYVLSTAGKKFKKEIERKFWTTFG